jgi:two-component system phosphate regulon sensor histidine kinase PhoR
VAYLEVIGLIVAIVVSGGLGAAGTALFFRLRNKRRLKELSMLVKRVALGEPENSIGLTELEKDPELTELKENLKILAHELRVVILRISAERNTMSTLLANLSDGIISTDAGGQVTLVNEAARHLLSISPNLEIEGRSFMQVVRDHELNSLLKKTLEDGKERLQILEVGPRRPQLQVKTARIETVNAPGGEPTPLNGLVVLQDLSEVSRLERIRRDFVANISHELRTPLASIKVMVETLEAAIVDDPQAARDFLKRIDTEVDGLTQLVRELLELSRIESGQVKLNLQNVDLRELVETAVERLRPQAERRGLHISNLTPVSHNNFPLAQADPDRLIQVLINLTHNAIKFTQVGGSIWLSVEPGVSKRVLVKVTDTGVGIPPDDLTRVFERFYKVDKARAGGESGTGLGLAISKHIVQAHGGDIWVESKYGNGSTFFFTIPIAAN